MRQVILHRRDNIRAKFRQSNVILYGGQYTVKWFQSTVEPQPISIYSVSVHLFVKLYTVYSIPLTISSLDP